MFDRVPLRYLVPNAVTAVSMVLALAAIIQASRGRHESAAWLIVLCALLDRVDGVAARWMKACSEFGVQFDSLADLLAFCVAPGLLVYFLLSDDPRYASAFTPGPAKAVLVASVAAYTLSGAARLARFNVQTAVIGPAWFRGLPVTIAAGLVSTFILAAWELALPPVVVALLPAVLLACAVLMISTLWLPKSVDGATRGHVAPLAVGVTVVYGLALLHALPIVLFAVALTYAAGGFVVGRLRAPNRGTLRTDDRIDPR